MAQYGTDGAREALYINTQAAIGTHVAATQGSENAIECTEIGDVEFVGDPDIIRDDEPRAVLGGAPMLRGGYSVKLPFTTYLKHWGDTSDEEGHELSAFFAACPIVISPGASDGDDLTLDPSPAWTPTAGTADPVGPCEVCSFTYAEESGYEWKVKDCTGRVVEMVVDDGGKPIMLKCELMGILVSESNSTSLTMTDVTYDSQAKINFAGFTYTHNLAGTPYGVSAWTFDPQMVLERMPDGTGTNGSIVSFAGHKGNCILKHNVNATQAIDAYTEWSAAAEESRYFATDNTGNPAFSLELKNAALARPERSTAGQVRKFDFTLRGTSTATGNDHWQITFS